MCKYVICFVVALAMVSTASAVLVVDGISPVARWEFEGRFEDTTGHGYDGTPIGNAHIEGWDPLPQTGHLVLDASGMQADGPFEITTSFTLSAWIKIDIPRTGRFFFGGPWQFRTDDQAGSDHVWVEVRYPGSGFVDKFDTTFGGADPEGQLDGQWHHYAFILEDIGKFSVYFDGVLAPARDGTEKACDFGGIETIFFGTNAPGAGNALQGCMDDVRLYDVALTADQVRQLVVPEPATIALLGLGGLALLRVRRKRR